MKISVIVPVYNGEKTLRRCVDSIACQTYRDLEILLVDNGSTDGSRAICDEYAARDGRVRILSLMPNRGPAAARNMGLDEAKGEYVAFCDCDDTVPQSAYEHLWKASRNGTADIVCGDYLEVIRAGGRKIRHRSASAPFEKYMEGGAVWNRLFRQPFLEENRLRFELYRYGEDTLFVAQAYQKAKTVTSTGRIVYSYKRYMADSLVNTYSLIGLREYAAIQKKILETFRDEAAGYCRGYAIYLRNYWWKIPDMGDKEAGFHLLQDYIKATHWECAGAAFQAIFGVELGQFSSMNLGAYLASQPWLDERETVFRQFAEGKIGALYIAKYSLAWLGYKLTRMKRGNK